MQVSAGLQTASAAKKGTAFGVARQLQHLPPCPPFPVQLLAPGELQPELTGAEFEARRRRLLGLLPQGAVAVVPAAPIVHMAGVIPYPYRPDADFLYLTGIQQVRGQGCALRQTRRLWRLECMYCWVIAVWGTLGAALCTTCNQPQQCCEP